MGRNALVVSREQAHLLGDHSLDATSQTRRGRFDWAVPDEEVHAFVNDLERSVGTYLYGRRMYGVMASWESSHTRPDQPPVIRDFAQIWQAADKIVYSRTLQTVSSARTRIERDFDEAVPQLKAAVERDITVGGPELAAQAIEAGLVDELHLLLAPIVVGGGKQALLTTRRARPKTAGRALPTAFALAPRPPSARRSGLPRAVRPESAFRS